jgi:hypothetical protein
MALRMGLLRSSALQNDGLDVPVILQFRTPQETNPKGHWGPNCFLRKSSLFVSSLVVLVCLGSFKIYVLSFKFGPDAGAGNTYAPPHFLMTSRLHGGLRHDSGP